MPNRMKQRSGTAMQWSTANPVLLEGEIGVERDTLFFKIGDGATAWNALSYAAIPTAAGDTRYVLAASRGQANGVAPLNGSGKIDSSFLGSLRIVGVSTVADQAARLALPADDDAQFVVQSSTAQTFMLGGGLDPSVNANWTALPQPSTAGLQAVSEKNQANGYAGLGSDGKINAAQIPTLDGGTP